MKNSKNIDVRFWYVGATICYECYSYITTKLCHGGKDEELIELEGHVPNAIANEGKAVIEKWAKKKIFPQIKKQREAFLKRQKQNQHKVIALETNSRGILLKGTFSWSDSKKFWIVTLTDPIGIESLFCYGGHGTPFGAEVYPLFDETDSFTKRARIQAELILSQTYIGYRDRDKIRLIGELNKHFGKIRRKKSE